MYESKLAAPYSYAVRSVKPSQRSAVNQATRLSRQRVVVAAIRIADDGGIGALTMRRLGDDLGAGAMSVYYHVAGKEALLAAMVDAVVEEMELPLPSVGEDWKAALKRSALSTHRVLLAHPWATTLLLAGPTLSQPRLRQMDAILGCLRAAGFSARLTDHAYHALDSHVMGFTLWLVGISAGLERLGPVSHFSQLFDVDALPHLAEHAEQHQRERAPDEPGEFEFGLDLILDGLERLRDAG
jgi:AcrR family transcriptional regulator